MKYVKSLLLIAFLGVAGVIQAQNCFNPNTGTWMPVEYIVENNCGGQWCQGVTSYMCDYGCGGCFVGAQITCSMQGCGPAYQT